MKTTSRIPRKRTFFLLLWATAACFLAGCATAWRPAGQKIGSAHWTAVLPSGWMRLAMPAGVMLSKDGPYLQYIFIQEHAYGKKMRHAGQILTADMLPHEAAEVVIDNFRSDPGIRQFKVLSNTPDTLGGKMGFKLEYRYTDRQGVVFRNLYYGALLRTCFFSIRYTAAKRFYYEKDLPAFDTVRSHLRFP